MSLSCTELRHLLALTRAVEHRDPRWAALCRRLDVELDRTPEPIEVVFQLSLPLFTVVPKVAKRTGVVRQLRVELAPLLNAYAGMSARPWMLVISREQIDQRIMRALPEWPKARDIHQRRLVVATRHSSQEPDEVTLDVVAKMPVDRLVKAGILRGDKRTDIYREARWEKAPPKQGFLLLEVYACK